MNYKRNFMSIQKLVLLALVITFTACEDKVSESPIAEVVPDEVIITPISDDKCDNTVDYEGISDVQDITDTSVKISWAKDETGAGYALFQTQGDKLKMIRKITNINKQNITIKNLKAETDYQFLVRTISKKGHLDCNQNFKDITTTEKQTFISCQEIHEHYQGAKPSGVYEIDTDLTGSKAPFEVYCDMENNDGGWTRVFNHNTVSGLFANDAEAKETNVADVTNDKYSILSKLAEFKKSGKYEFWIYYPEHDGVDGGNIWTQISNPVTDAVSGYVAVRETYSDMHWGGLEKSSYSGTLIDGSVGSGWWFYAIGASRNWPSGATIPGPLRSTGVNEVQLFVR
jgi:hypothetical protein